MKTTPLYDAHIALGAKMAPFAGYMMPLQYEGINIEHNTVRNGVGIFDVSHMGEILISGSGSLELIQKITSNDASKLEIGQAQYSYIPNETGGIIDDLIVYRIKESLYLLVVNAGNISKDFNWIISKNSTRAEVKNMSDEYSLLAIQGPNAVKAVQNLSSLDLSAIKYYNFKVGDFAGIKNVILSATGYTGSGGLEIYCKNTEVKQIWNRVLELGAAYDIKPIGLAARNTLRLEMGYCLYGNDIDETTSPFEAGLGWITKFNKQFTNSENLRAEKREGPGRKLIAFELHSRGIPRNGYDIVDSNGKTIGKVTSGTLSPTLGKGIGLGYVPTKFANFGSKINIQIRKKSIPASVVKLPFYKK